MAEVYGNGSDSCPGAPRGKCFFDGLTITGYNLHQVSFRLEDRVVERSFVLVITEQTANSASVTLPIVLAEGAYTLVAVNDHGETHADLGILQGDPGATGAAGTYTPGTGILIASDTISVDFGQVAAETDLATLEASVGAIQTTVGAIQTTVGGHTSVISALDGNYVQNSVGATQTASIDIDGNALIGGNVGVGTTSPAATLDVAGGVRIGNATVCDAARSGTLRWTGSDFQGCNGSIWVTLNNARPQITEINAAAFIAPTRITFTDTGGECTDKTTAYTGVTFSSTQGFRDVNTGSAVDGKSGSSATCSSCSNSVAWTLIFATPITRYGMYYLVGPGEASTVQFTDSAGNDLGTLTVTNGQAFVGAESTTDIKEVLVTPTGSGHCIDDIIYE